MTRHSLVVCTAVLAIVGSTIVAAEKKPEPPVKKPRGPVPGWVPFAVLVALAMAIYFARQAGWLGA